MNRREKNAVESLIAAFEECLEHSDDGVQAMPDDRARWLLCAEDARKAASATEAKEES